MAGRQAGRQRDMFVVEHKMKDTLLMRQARGHLAGRSSGSGSWRRASCLGRSRRWV